MVATIYLIIAVPIGYFIGSGASGQLDIVSGRDASAVFALFLILPVLLGLSFYFGVWRQAKKTEAITESATAIFSDSGLMIDTTSSTSETNWSRFKKIYLTKFDIIFFPYENVFFSIPKRFFNDDEELERVVNILRINLGINLKVKK